MTAYSMQPGPGTDCTDVNYLNDKFCTLREVFGNSPNP